MRPVTCSPFSAVIGAYEMPLLATIASDLVQQGYWLNQAAPVYRQHLWATTNLTAFLVLALVGVTGSLAGERLWAIMRHCLQPAVQLPNPLDKLRTVSRTRAVKELWTQSRLLQKELATVWNENKSPGAKIWDWAHIMGGRGSHVAANFNGDMTNIPTRFGVCAIISVVSLAILGIFIPFFLSEGLQAETTVIGRTVEGHADEYLASGWAMFDSGMRQGTNRDYEKCFDINVKWLTNDYCNNLRRDLPTYTISRFQISGDGPSHGQFRFLAKHGNKTYNAIKFTQNTTFFDIGINRDPSGTILRHELTCLPVPLDPFVLRTDSGMYQLKMNDLFPQKRPHSDSGLRFHDTLWMKTSNAFGVGHQLAMEFRGAYPIGGGYELPTRPPTDERDPATAEPIWVQTDVDAALPAISRAGGINSEHWHANAASRLIQGTPDFQLHNFLLTFKPFLSSGYAPKSWDDPVFSAHTWFSKVRDSQEEIFVADREITAVGCVEIFSICSACVASEPCLCRKLPKAPERGAAYRPGKNALEFYYPRIMSVWYNALIDPTYGTRMQFGAQPRNFFQHNMDGRQSQRRWEEDVEERFLRSMLRARNMVPIAAHRALYNDNIWPISRDLKAAQLYRSADFTNVNVWGTVAVVAAYMYIILGSYWFALLAPITLPSKAIYRGVQLTPALYTRCFQALKRGALAVWRLLKGVTSRFRMLSSASGSARSLQAPAPTISLYHIDTQQDGVDPDDPLPSTP